MRKILVTGGAGYVGSALLDLLVEDGYRVRILDDFSLSDPGNLFGQSSYEFVRGDVRDGDTVGTAMENIDAVIHLAAITGASESHDNKDEVVDVNRGGTETVLEAAEREGVERVILASSCNVYGETNAEHLLETADPSPRNPYAESKLAAERACRESSLNTVCLRLATNYGWSPGIRFNLVINDFVFRALHDEPLTVYGDGTNWRPFIHVRDSARAFRSALSWDPGVYNVGEANLRLDDVTAAISGGVGRPVETTYLEDRDPGPSYHVDVSKMRGQGFMPETGFLEGIEHLVERFRPRRTAGEVHG